MASQRLDHRGYPVPWFVQWIDGVPDFRVMDGAKLRRALRDRLCWVCGEKLGKYLTFVIGPMCAVNRTTAEPASHRDCAIFSATACPFLTLPKAQRREANLPEGGVVAGNMISRNPGVTCLWTTLDYRPFRADRNDGAEGVLLEIGEPTEVLWYTQCREATRAEVLESIHSGLPLLEAEAKRQGLEAEQALARYVERGLRYVPGESA